MIAPEYIEGLPFYTPRGLEDFMEIRELIEKLISLKEVYNIGYPDDKYINMVCNILESMPQNKTTNEIIERMKDRC